MNILVTGASGSTGSNLTRRLVAEGHDVRVLLRRSSNQKVLAGAPVQRFFGDLSEAENLPENLMHDIDIVFHIAAAWQSENMPDSYFHAVNVRGTERLLHLADQAGVKRFVHCSTVGVQGAINSPPATEDHPYNPGDHYQRTKMWGELLALDFFRNHRLQGTVVRPAGIYGPGDLRFLKLFKTIEQGHFRMIGSGRTLYHLTYIDDLVEGIILAGTQPAGAGQIFTIGGERPVTLAEFASRIARILGRRLSGWNIPVLPVWFAAMVCEMICRPMRIQPPLYRRRVHFFTKNRAFDISKARKLLNYNPKIQLDEGLRKTIAWYKQQGLLGAAGTGVQMNNLLLGGYGFSYCQELLDLQEMFQALACL